MYRAILTFIIVATFGVLVWAQADPAPVLPGRPDAVVAPPAATRGPIKLGDALEFSRAGVSVRPPVGMKAIRYARPDEIVQFVDQQRQWTISLKRYILPEPYPLTSVHAARGANRTGMVEVTLLRIKQAAPDADVLRNDTTFVGEAETGMLALRYNVGTQKKLNQRALIQANEQMYYDLAMVSPGTAQKDAEDPAEREAVEAFRTVLDSVKLLDLADVKRDQEERLFNTRALFMELGPKMQKVLIPEQWFRVQRDGKDIGYSYHVERIDKKAAGQGVEVGTRTRLLREEEQDDFELMRSVTHDLKHEQFSQLFVSGKTSEKFDDRNWSMGFGTSDRNTQRVYDAEQDRFTKDKDKSKQPAVRLREICTLNVAFYGRHSNPEPFTQGVPPWYLPQATSHLLPRLLPLAWEKKYMFASYQGDENFPMVRSRYVDVLRDRDVVLAGQKVRAVPITDWMDEGTVTTHYMSMDGKYLGSETKIDHGDVPPSTVTVIPSDVATIMKIWPEANTKAPAEAQRPATRPTARK